MVNFRKLQVFTKTTDFKKAVKVVAVPLTEPEPDRIRVKQLYAGVNAADISITAGRFSPDGKIPFDIGLEVGGFAFVVAVSEPLSLWGSLDCTYKPLGPTEQSVHIKNLKTLLILSGRRHRGRHRFRCSCWQVYRRPSRSCV